MANLQAHDRSWVTQQLRALPARIENAKQEEMGEMMGKLKEVRRITRSCLRPTPSHTALTSPFSNLDGCGTSVCGATWSSAGLTVW